MTREQTKAEAVPPPPALTIAETRESDPELDALREILLWRYRKQIADLQTELKDIERRLDDKRALLAVITPVLGDAIRTKVLESRDEMVEALYPIIGRLVVRAVTEAMRDLARTIDSRLRQTFTPQTVWRRWRARLSGVSGAELALRDALPFSVTEVFLVHRDSGLLLCHVATEAAAARDSDLVSSMLTAIRDFAHEAFGRGADGSLDEIQFGERRILIEAGLLAYLAVVVDGVEPVGYRSGMREQVLQIERAYSVVLRPYDGDATRLAALRPSLTALLGNAR